MSYLLSNPSMFFRAHNTALQTGVTGVFELSQYYNCVQGATAHTISTDQAYVYAETRTSGYTKIPNFDTILIGTTTMQQEGSQWWNNSTSTYCPIDDGCYGIVSGDTSLQVGNYYSGNTGESDAEETRIFGIKVKP